MSEAYERDSFFVAYTRWHYGRGLTELFGVSGNFLWFVAHFFSFKLLLKTLFTPWKRLGEHYSGGFDLEAFATILVVNSLMRVVGFGTRTIVLVVGLAAYLLVLVVSFFVLLIWILAPLVLIGSAVLSVTFFSI